MRYRQFLTRLHELLRSMQYLGICGRSGDSLALAQCLVAGIDPYYAITGELGNQVHLFRATCRSPLLIGARH